jgi:hypothetical protein
VASRKEQKEALRREREQRERVAREAERRKRLVGYGAAGALGVAVVVVLIVLALSGGGGGGGGEASADVLPDGGEVPAQKTDDLSKAAETAGCQLKSARGKPGEHTQDPNERVQYDTNPPTTGKHYVEPAADQAYGKAPTDEQLVHTEEHGRVIVWFKPSLPKDVRANLKALFEEDNYQMVLAPRANMPYAVAATAWNGEPAPNGRGRLLLCERFDARVFDAIRSFRDEHRGNGPEPVP